MTDMVFKTASFGTGLLQMLFDRTPDFYFGTLHYMNAAGDLTSRYRFAELFGELHGEIWSIDCLRMVIERQVATHQN